MAVPCGSISLLRRLRMVISNGMGIARVGTSAFPRESREKNDSAVRGRVESIIRRLVRPAIGAGWILGIFDSNRDLLEFAVSGVQANRRPVLSMLCTMPVPETPGRVTLRVTDDEGRIATCLGASAMLDGERSLVFAMLRPQTSSAEWKRVAQGLEKAISQIVDVVLSELLPATEERLSLASLRSSQQGFFLLTQEFKAAFEWHPEGAASTELAELVAPQNGSLPEYLEPAVRRLTKSWDFSRIETCVAGTAYPIPGFSVRVAPMRGDGILIAVFVEPCRGRVSIDHMAANFNISPREREVLHALLDGHSVSDIGEILNLAESTVNDHIGRLIVKTNSRNRIEMASTLLGWPMARSTMAAAPDPPKSASVTRLGRG
jgi:DNA-binding CsgD family transcriptional regulator